MTTEHCFPFILPFSSEGWTSERSQEGEDPWITVVSQDFTCNGSWKVDRIWLDGRDSLTRRRMGKPCLGETFWKVPNIATGTQNLY